MQAYLSILVGGLLAFNVILPTDEPSIPRLIVRARSRTRALAQPGHCATPVACVPDAARHGTRQGMWSVWIFSVPSLRARDCPKREKDALNVLFLAIPLVNVLLPLLYKSFAAVFTADVALWAALYVANGALDGFPDTPEDIAAAAAAAEAAEAEAKQQ